jgi:hypothetical protein
VCDRVSCVRSVERFVVDDVSETTQNRSFGEEVHLRCVRQEVRQKRKSSDPHVASTYQGEAVQMYRVR